MQKKEAIKAKKFMGLVPQELALMETISAYDNLEFFWKSLWLKRKTIKRKDWRGRLIYSRRSQIRRFYQR